MLKFRFGLLLFISGVSFAQNIGINVKSPLTTLQVNSNLTGGINLKNSTGNPRLSFFSDTLPGSASLFAIGIDATDANKFKIGTTGVDASTRFTILPGGNIGIGTTNPAALLDIAGMVSLNKIISPYGQDIIVNPGNLSTLGYGNVMKFGAGTGSPIGGFELAQFDDEAGFRSDVSYIVASGPYGPGWPEMHYAVSGGSLSAPTISNANSPITYFNFDGHNGTSYCTVAQIGAVLETGVSSTNMPGALVFGTSGGAVLPDNGSFAAITERMRLASNGFLGLNTSTPGRRVEILDHDTAQLRLSYSGYVYTDLQTTSGGNLAIIPTGGNVGIGTVLPGYMLDVQGGDINASANVRAAGTVLTSDIRLKRNVVNLENGISSVMQLRPVTYQKKANLESVDYSKNEMGFIAQEVQKLFPQLVVEGNDKDRILALDYNSLIAVLTRAIQEQQKLIEEQKTKLSAQGKQMESYGRSILTLQDQMAELKAKNTASK